MYVTYGTTDLPRAERFYGPTLATLGMVQKVEAKDEYAYGIPGDTDPIFYILKPFDGKPATCGNGTMLTLTAATRAAVDAFHAAALAHGGTDEGAPGIRYTPTFYSCYVRDPDGNKLSAACDRPA